MCKLRRMTFIQTIVKPASTMKKNCRYTTYTASQTTLHLPTFDFSYFLRQFSGTPKVFSDIHPFTITSNGPTILGGGRGLGEIYRVPYLLKS